MSKCVKCSHQKLCIHESSYISLVKKINQSLPGEEMIAMGDNYPFSVDVNCKYFAEQEKIIRDRLLQQQYNDSTNIGTNIKQPVNPNFYGYGRDEN